MKQSIPQDTAQTNDLSLATRIALVIGLGCLFSSLLIYSSTTISFLRFESAPIFMGTFAETLLCSAMLVSALLVGINLAGYRIPFMVLTAFGGVGYVCCSLAFVLLSWTGSPSDFLVMAVAALAALSDCCLCLAWGRLCARLRIRQALVVVPLASVWSAILCKLYSVVPLIAVVSLFAFACVVAVVIPLALANIAVSAPAGQSTASHKLRTTLFSMLDVSAAPGLGLIAFAFAMAIMRTKFNDSQDTYFIMLAVGSIALVAFVAWRKKPISLHSGMHQTLLPLLAMVLLAATSITATLHAGELIVSVLTYALYGLAAVLTLSTLCAIAHAGEFHPDLVFSTAVFLFTGASFFGQMYASTMDDSFIPVAVTITTTLYAFIMVLSSYIRRHRVDAVCEQSATPELTTFEGVTARCARIANDYGLTLREEEILTYLAEGHNGTYIADALFISPNTARTHIHNIYRKLDVSSREDILRLTKETDEVPPQVQR